MQVLKNRAFARWAQKEGLSDADLGGHIFKKRVAIGGRGKSGGVRTLLAYRIGDKAFFIYGFAKNARANIGAKELKALKLYGDVLLNYSKAELSKAAKSGEFIEVVNSG